jgi:hypothetical protein
VQRLSKDPFGFFEFAPPGGLDLDLLDRVLVAARQEAGSVDVVILPESTVEDREIDNLEALLDGHGVVTLVAGVRQTTRQPDRFPSNWLHMGFNPRLEKGGVLPSEGREPWFHLRQNKHNRWSLGEDQVEQYHLGAALHPHIRWWEAMDVPRKAIQFVEVAELVQVWLVCEDLAHNDDIAQLIRSVGPTVVITVLLDGPQLTSRWTARYASVLADDPGSAVLTLTPYGMVERSRPHGREASRVIALWKDPTRGVRDVPAQHGEPSLASRSHPLDSPTPSNRLAGWLEQPPYALGHRYSTPCSHKPKRITPAKQTLTKWSGARCSRCSRNGGPGNQPKQAARAK